MKWGEASSVLTECQILQFSVLIRHGIGLIIKLFVHFRNGLNTYVVLYRVSQTMGSINSKFDFTLKITTFVLQRFQFRSMLNC